MLIIAGLVFVSLVFLFINYLIYGSPLQTPNSQMNLPKFSWGGSGYTLNHGLVDAVSYLIVFSILFTCGLPAIFGLFIILPLFNFRHFWKGAICLVAILLIIVSMASYDDPWGVFLGARFWHEILPFLAVLIALSFDLFLSIDQRGIVSRLIILSLILVVGSQNFRGWIKGEKLWSGLSYFVPHQLEDLKTFNFTDTRLIRKAKELNLKHAVVFVKHCDHWWCYGSVTDENSINFDGNIVWAHDLGDQNYQLIDQFPTRSFYFADYDQGTITPYHLP